MSLIIQVMITGGCLGAVYGLFALCLSVLYRLTGIVHLAIGELAGVAAFTMILVVQGRHPAATGEGANLVAILMALVITGGLGALVYRAAIRPFVRRGFSIAWIGGVVAAGVTLRGLLHLVFPGSVYRVDLLAPISKIGNDGVVTLGGGGATIQLHTVAAGAVGIALIGGAVWWIERSRFGMQLKAISNDRVGAALCGVNAGSVELRAFALSSLLVAVAGMAALSGQAVTISSGSVLGLKGLIAAVAARFGPPRHVVTAGIVLGVVETGIGTLSVGRFELGPAYSAVIPIALAIVLLSTWRERTPLQEEAR